MVVGLLATGLARAGHEVMMVAHPDSHVPGVEVIPAPRVPDGVTIGQVATELTHVVWGYRQLIARGPDVIHDHTTAGPVTGASRARDAGIPVVATNHGPFDDNARVLFAEASEACAIVAISRDQARSSGPVPISAVIHHGIEVSHVPVGAGSGGYFAYLGRFTPAKGVARAARIAHAAGAPLRIAAKMWEPAEVDYFHAEVEPLLGDTVEYVGELGGEAKYEFLGAAIGLLNPIDWPEPFGLSMIESFACGTPVLAAPLGSAPELLTDGRTGVLAGSDDEFVAALHGCNRFDRASCRQTAETRFSTARMADDHIALYRQVIDAVETARFGAPRLVG